MLHDFKTALAKSEKVAGESWWKTVYEKFFYNFENMTSLNGDSTAQRAGIDRIVITKNGDTYKIDEKVRHKKYPDFCLEYLSATGNGFETPGWIEKDLRIDYIAYVIEPEKSCYFLPWTQLKSAWLANKGVWKHTYEIFPVDNTSGARSYCVGVPRDVVYAAMAEVSRTSW